MSNFLLRRHGAADRYATQLSAIYREGQRIWDPSYALAEEPDIYWKARLDPVVDGSIERRLHSIVGREWVLEPGGDAEIDKVAAGICTEIIRRCRRFDTSRKNLAEADIHGASFGYIRDRVQTDTFFDGKPRKWLVCYELADVDKRRMRAYATADNAGRGWTVEWRMAATMLDAQRHYAHPGERGKQGMLRVQPWDGRAYPLKHPEKMVKHLCMDQESTLGYGRGLLDSLYYYHRAKTLVLREGLIGVERWAGGLLHARIDGMREASTGKLNSDIANEWLEVLENMRARHALVSDKLDELQFEQPPMTGHQMVKDFLDYLDKWIIIRIEGSYLPSAGSGEGGAYAQAAVQRDTSQAMIAFARDSLDETLTADFVSYIFNANKPTMRDIHPALERAKCPVFRTIEEQVENPTMNIQVVSAGLQAGLTFKREEVYRRLGWEMPDDDDEVVGAQQQPQMPGMGQGMPGAPPDQAEPPGGVGEGEPGQDAGPDAGGMAMAAVRRGLLRFGRAIMWDESKHPRNPDGTFRTKGEAGSLYRDMLDQLGAMTDMEGVPRSVQKRAAGMLKRFGGKDDPGWEGVAALLNEVNAAGITYLVPEQSPITEAAEILTGEMRDARHWQEGSQFTEKADFRGPRVGIDHEAVEAAKREWYDKITHLDPARSPIEADEMFKMLNVQVAANWSSATAGGFVRALRAVADAAATLRAMGIEDRIEIAADEALFHETIPPEQFSQVRGFFRPTDETITLSPYLEPTTTVMIHEVGHMLHHFHGGKRYAHYVQQHMRLYTEWQEGYTRAGFDPPSRAPAWLGFPDEARRALRTLVDPHRSHILPGQRTQNDGMLSVYATMSPQEFCAEVFTKLAVGETILPEVWQWYREFGGYVPKGVVHTDVDGKQRTKGPPKEKKRLSYKPRREGKFFAANRDAIHKVWKAQVENARKRAARGEKPEPPPAPPTATPQDDLTQEILRAIEGIIKKKLPRDGSGRIAVPGVTSEGSAS